MRPLKLLILGGTTEASALARALAGDARFDATLSLAGRTRSPVQAPIARRVGGFGGAEGLADYLAANHVEAVVDATHPFAARITANAQAAAARAGVPLLAICRPPWQAVDGDRWTEVATMAAAAPALGTTPRRVLLTVGQQDLQPFIDAPWHSYVLRSVEPPQTAPPGAEIITARGPFHKDAELALLKSHRIDVLVTKNSGGSATSAKLVAARELGLPVVMVARPSHSASNTVPDADAALRWLVQRHAGSARRGV